MMKTTLNKVTNILIEWAIFLMSLGGLIRDFVADSLVVADCVILAGFLILLASGLVWGVLRLSLALSRPFAK